MYIHVICCNDNVEFAVVEDEAKAKIKMRELKNNHFERNKWSFNDKDEYADRFYWHIHTVLGA